MLYNLCAGTCGSCARLVTAAAVADHAFPSPLEFLWQLVPLPGYQVGRWKERRYKAGKPALQSQQEVLPKAFQLHAGATL